MGGLGGSLILGGLLAPRLLGPIYRAWMGLAHLLSKVTTPVFMGIVYFGVLTPTGLLMRLFGKRPLRHGENGGGFWIPRKPPAEGADTMSRQF